MQPALWKCLCVAIWCGWIGFCWEWKAVLENWRSGRKLEGLVYNLKVEAKLRIKVDPHYQPHCQSCCWHGLFGIFFPLFLQCTATEIPAMTRNVQTPFRPIQGTNIFTEMVALLQGWVCVLKYFCADNLNIFVVENMGSAAGPKRERNIRIFAALAPTRNS